MEKKYCLLDENGEIYTLTNAADAFNELELEDAIAMYGVNCYYQRVHNDIIKLIERKGNYLTFFNVSFALHCK